MRNILVFKYFIYSIKLISAAKILAVVPSSSISHTYVFRPVIKELIKHHEVVFWTADPEYEKGQVPANLTELDFHELSYDVKPRLGLLNQLPTLSPVEFSHEIYAYMNYVFQKQVQSKVGQDFLKTSHNFDLIIMEACSRMAITLTHIFKAPVMRLTSYKGTYEDYISTASPTHTLLYPEALRQRIHNLTSFELIQGFYEELQIRSYRSISERVDNRVARELFGSDFPSISTLEDNVEMVGTNVDPAWDGYRPVSPSIIYLGGLHQKPVKPLPQDLQTYLDSSKHGVIFLSFGSNIEPAYPNQVPSKSLQSIIKVLSRLPYDVLFKYSGDLPGKPNNVRIQKWFPQADLLRHPKVKLFITQAGQQSTDEAITAEVPLIALPIIFDQWYNADKYEEFGIGIRLNLNDLTEKALENAVKTILNNKSYQENIARLGALMRDQPQSPLQRAVWWTEYMLRHRGARHLSPTRATWSEYLVIDVMILLLGISLAVMYLTVRVLQSVYGLLINKKIKWC